MIKMMSLDLEHAAPAPMRLLCFLSLAVGAINLPVNYINIVVVTDVHSWVGGHERHEPQWNADYGHVLSFYERLQTEWKEDQNLFFVMNGDFMDGTGLSTYPPSHLAPILQKMPWDALNIGNHELYRNSTIEYITESGFADYWGDKYVTSNVLRADNGKPLGPLGGARHTILEGPSAKVLVFGFLYNMTDNSPLVIVEPVEQVVEQEWFTTALKGDYQAIVCLVDMDVKDPLISVIQSKIRSVVGDDMPVQFIAGHSHIRAFNQVDERSTSFEAGHYLDTVGFVSFDKEGSNFEHVFIEANMDALQSIVGVDDIMTENGRQLQQMIRTAEEEMGLLDRIGCSPDRFHADKELSHPQSLWGLYMDKVINYYFDGSSAFVYVQASDGLRYDLFQGQVALDDLKAVSPYNNTIFRVTNELKGKDLVEVLGGRINSVEDSVPGRPNLPEYVCSVNVIDPDKTYELYTDDFDLVHFVARVGNVTGQPVNPVSQNMATTLLWVEFVSEKWQKEGDCQDPTSSAHTVLLFLVGLAFSALLVVVVIVMSRRRALVGYDVAVETTENVDGSTNQMPNDDDYVQELI